VVVGEILGLGGRGQVGRYGSSLHSGLREMEPAHAAKDVSWMAPKLHDDAFSLFLFLSLFFSCDTPRVRLDFAL
jgi:hypothetical protein